MESLPFPLLSPEETFAPLKRIEGARLLVDFPLYHRHTQTRIDLLVFLPCRGLYLGEKLSWKMSDLKGSTVSKAAPRSKTPPMTRFDSTQSVIAQKLQDVLSFDSTPCYRFVWMEYLSEAEFDSLDSSFHELLPKNRVIFRDESDASLLSKFEAVDESCPEPLSELKVLGSLSAHTLRLPTAAEPFGAFLSEEQQRFLSHPLTDGVLTLLGGFGSGKSTALIRKALEILLEAPHNRLLIITPTRLAGELFRNEIASLAEFSAVDLDLSHIRFFTPKNAEELATSELLQEATVALCDDAHLLDRDVLDALYARRRTRPLITTSVVPGPDGGNTVLLSTAYRPSPDIQTRYTSSSERDSVLIEELRQSLEEVSPAQIMVILPDETVLRPIREAILDELALNAKVLTPDFSLQYGDLDALLLSLPEASAGLARPRLFLILPEEADDYRHLLSRASERATIIFVSNPPGENDAENPQE